MRDFEISRTHSKDIARWGTSQGADVAIAVAFEITEDGTPTVLSAGGSWADGVPMAEILDMEDFRAYLAVAVREFRVNTDRSDRSKRKG